MRVAPDDDVYRVNAVWLGPRGLTFPWTARYLAYATWLVTFLVVLLVEAIVPALHPGVPPVWEICITTLFTYAVMSFVDHERPVRAVWRTFLADLAAPRASGKARAARLQVSVRVHERPRHDRRLTRAYFAGAEHTVPTHATRYTDTRAGGEQVPLPPQPRRPRTTVRAGAPGTPAPRPADTATADTAPADTAPADTAPVATAAVATAAVPKPGPKRRRRR